MKVRLPFLSKKSPHYPPLLRVLGAFLWGEFLWIVLTGFDRAAMLAGLPAAGVFAWLVGSHAPEDFRIHFRAIPAFSIYFIYQSFRTGLDVAYRALNPDREINPGFCTYPSRLPEGSPQALFANMISILPGTLSWGLEDGIHKIHLLAGYPLILEDLALLESRVARLYGIDIPEELF